MKAILFGATGMEIVQGDFLDFSPRPAFIQPRHGIVSRTGWTRVHYSVAGPLYPAWKALFPAHVTTTEELGRAMIRVAREGAPRRILESGDLVGLGRGDRPGEPGRDGTEERR